MPWSGAAGAALGAGEPSTKSCLGGLTLQNTGKTENTHSASYCEFEPGPSKLIRIYGEEKWNMH